ncbi:activating transcription factor 7-interacting protein 2-like isoform X2 [Biomphalaria glabrata]|uniref:Activating transcription factor 7-interacting protein 1-like isoform X2 n=1 Tax=Biomphalaria glabrata TaxID=6526 RepID=A0A9W2ZJH3_BIOGL|nr:activating transcription factor 7-interacting protein 1-like isoform X2 [Biomphalaria glabrata]KAI8766536.1 activating transcription factor 7-interacting protein 2-like isoform X2 [Biomphalaria glabrata]
MADITLVEGQRDTINSHINVLRNNCSITLDNKENSNFEVDKPLCHSVSSREYNDSTVSSLELHSVECSETIEDIIPKMVPTPHSYSSNVNNLEPKESVTTLQNMSQALETSIELRHEKPDNIEEALKASKICTEANSDSTKVLEGLSECDLETAESVTEVTEASKELDQKSPDKIEVCEINNECSQQNPDSIGEVSLLEFSDECVQEKSNKVDEILETSDEIAYEKPNSLEVMEASNVCVQEKPISIAVDKEVSYSCELEKHGITTEEMEVSNECVQEKPDCKTKVIEASNECRLKKSDDVVELVAEVNCEHNDQDSLTDNSSSMLIDTEHDSNLLENTIIAETAHNASDHISESPSGDICSEFKDIDFYNSTGDQLAVLNNNSSHTSSSCLSNHVEDLDTYSKNNKALACLSVDKSPIEDSPMKEPANSDVQERLNSSEEDLYIDETDNQEDRVCEDSPDQRVEEMEMSEIKIGESLSITDSDYVNDLRDKNVFNGNSEEKIDESSPSVLSVISYSNAAIDIPSPTADIAIASPNSECVVTSHNASISGASKTTIGVASSLENAVSANGTDSSNATCEDDSSTTTSGVASIASPVAVNTLVPPNKADSGVDELVISDSELEDKDTDLDLVIVESGSVDDADKENNCLTSKEIETEDSKMTESTSYEDSDKIVNSPKTNSPKNVDKMPAKKVDDSHNTKASSNSNDLLLNTSTATNEAMDMDDDIVLLDDFDTPHTSPNTEKTESISFKNVLRKPSSVSSTCIDDHKTNETSCEGKESNNKEEDLVNTEDNLKNENRKRYSIEEFSSNTSKRAKIDTNVSDVKDQKVDIADRSSAEEDKQRVAEIGAEKKEESQLTFQTTTEVLQAFIAVHFKTLMKNQKLINTEKLNRKTRIMQSTTNLWKETAKHLEKSVLDLTIMTKKLDKRKAHANTLKNLANKSIGIQVHIPENQAKSSNQAQVQSPSTNKRVDTTSSVGLFTSSPVNVPTQNQPTRTQFQNYNNNQGLNKNPAKTMPQNVSLAPKKMVAQCPAPSAQKSIPSPRQTSGPNNRVQQQQNAKAPLSSQGNSTMDSTLIDLTDEDDITRRPRPPSSISSQNTPSPRNLPAAASTPSSNMNPVVTKSTTIALPQSFLISAKHPAPLPHNQDTGNAPPNAKNRPPKPGLKISRVSQGIVLSWNMPILENVERIASYQLFAYQENENSVPKSSLWKKVGDVKALPLPMACTLTQFQEGNRYHFSVRAVDHYGRCGQYSDPSSIFLGPKA